MYVYRVNSTHADTHHPHTTLEGWLIDVCSLSTLHIGTTEVDRTVAKHFKPMITEIWPQACHYTGPNNSYARHIDTWLHIEIYVERRVIIEIIIIDWLIPVLNCWWRPPNDFGHYTSLSRCFIEHGEARSIAAIFITLLFLLYSVVLFPTPCRTLGCRDQVWLRRCIITIHSGTRRRCMNFATWLFVIRNTH